MAPDPKVAWRRRLVDAELQALEDVACSGAVSTSVLESERSATAALAEIAEEALGAGFAVATASLADHGLHGLDEVVRAFALDLRVPGKAQRKGLVAALEAFAAGRKAEERFEEAADQEGLFGELRALAAGYIAAASGQAASRRLHAWLRGDDPTRAADAEPLRTLSPRTAKPALAALTRLARALGARATLLILTDGEALAELSPARRDVAYTVLRELIDNGDGGRGMTAAKLVVVASAALFEGSGSIASHAALVSRLAAAAPASPSPHAPRVSIEPLAVALGAAPPVEAPEPRRAKALRTMLRVAQGLPPIDASQELTIGMEEVDQRIDKLFETTEHDGSVFAVLLGEYGAGKTHHLLHIEARGLADKRPVLWLSIERLDEDLGNPQRHLRRLLEGAALPGPGTPTPLDRLEHWLGSDAGRRRLGAALDTIAAADLEATPAARRALRSSDDALDEASVRETLGALDLVDKPSQPSYRRDAYARLHLWLELLARLDGCEGPVVLLDEAENLYRPGVSRAERRTALRSLGYYCGGALPRACVVLAVTPASLEELRAEAGELLDAIEEQRTLLPNEDVTMLRRRLLRARPIEVTRLGKADLVGLGTRARALYEKLHGRVSDPAWDGWLKRAAADAESPRALLRAAALRLERIAWGAPG